MRNFMNRLSQMRIKKHRIWYQLQKIYKRLWSRAKYEHRDTNGRISHDDTEFSVLCKMGGAGEGERADVRDPGGASAARAKSANGQILRGHKKIRPCERIFRLYSASSSSARRVRTNVNVEPSFSTLSTTRLKSWRLAISRTMESPRPTPVGFSSSRL